MYTLEDDPVAPLTLTDEGSKIVPNQKVVDARAQKADYALGEKSPGVEKIKTEILSGNETGFREKVAADNDLETDKLRQEFIARIAAQRGGNLTPEDISGVQALSQAELRSDPNTILEKKFADKYVADVASTAPKKVQAENIETVMTDADRMAEIVQRKLFFQHRLEDLKSEWEQTGWLKAIPDYIGATVQVLPGLNLIPWYRQAHALKDRPGIEFLPGGTMRANIQYMWTLPPAERERTYNQAIEYLKGKNMLDALTFAEAMVSYSMSDEYLGNIFTIADNATAIFGIGSRLFRGKRVIDSATNTLEKAAAEAPPSKPGVAVKTEYYKDASRWNGEVVTGMAPQRQPEQLDLFGAQPEQGAFRFADEVSTAPERTGKYVVNPNTGVYRNQRGQMRQSRTPEIEVNSIGMFRDPVTGQMRRSTEGQFPNQGSLDLNVPQHQRSLDLTPPAPKKPPEVPPAPPDVTEVRVMMKDAAKAIADPNPDPVHVAAAIGDTQRASWMGGLRRLNGPMAKGFIDLLDEVPSIANPEAFLRGSKSLGREGAQRLSRAINDGRLQSQELIQAFMTALRGQRLTPEALTVARQEAETYLRREYEPRIGNGALDFEYIPAEAHPANVDTLIGWVGKSDANTFKSMDEAKVWARDVYKLPNDGYFIEQIGGAYRIGVARVLDETTDLARREMVTLGNITPRSILNMLTNRLRSTEDLLSKFQSTQRITATQAIQGTRAKLADVYDNTIGKLSKAHSRELNDILVMNRDTVIDGQRGAWYRNATELEQAWVQRHGHLPTAAQIEAYDTYVRLNDFDWLVRNIGVIRDKARMGVERWSFSVDGKPTEMFEGKRLDSMPWGLKNEQDAGVFIYDSTTGKAEFKYKNGMSLSERESLNQMIRDGWGVVQLFEPKKRPLNDLVKTKAGSPVADEINFVVTKDLQRHNLSWKQVDYNPGGHSIYPGDFYVAQPKIAPGRQGRDTYSGDSNILNIRTEAEAKMWAERLDRIRILLRGGKHAEAEAYRAANLPHSADDIAKLFTARGALLSLNEPVTYKQAGKNVFDTVDDLKMRYPNAVDGTKDNYDLSNFMDKSYLSDRDSVIKTIRENGGIYQLTDAEQLDPIAALNKAMNQGLRNIWMNDYKIQAVETWLKEFSSVMKPSESSLAAHPSYYLFNPQWNEKADRATLAAAKASQRAITQLLGQQSELGMTTKYIQQKLMNSVYNRLGQKGVDAVETVSKFTDDLGLGTIKDPVAFMRASAFHMKLGLFNPVQLFLQAQSIAHVVGVAGVQHGVPGVAAAVLSRFVAHNEGMAKELAKKAKAFGWKESDFLEMVEGMKGSGVWNVASEAVLREDAIDQRLFRTAGQYILDKGSMFFNEGERIVRLSAYATAFREAKAAKGAAKLSERDLQDVLQRANLLSLNMTRASSASWQSGVVSVPTQFFAFNARLAEQFLGNRLTTAEKLRAFATYSALYGIPTGAGIVTMGVSPLGLVGIPTSYEDIKTEAIRRGIDLSPAYLEAMSEGILSMALHYATGKQTNFTARYGPGATTALASLLQDDKSWTEIVFGASGTVLKDAFKATYPFMYSAASVFGGNDEYPVVGNDFLTLFRNIASVDTASKVYGVLNYNKWYVKSGLAIGPEGKDYDSMDAALAALGLTPKDVSDTYLNRDALKGQKEKQAPYEKQALLDYQLGLQALAQGDTAGYDSYMKRAAASMTTGDFNIADRKRIFERAVQQNRSLSDKIKWDLILKAPASQMQNRLNNFERQ